MNISKMDVLLPSARKLSSKGYKTKPMGYDCVSFGAIKKSQLYGIDLAVANKFNKDLHIEQYNSNDDFQRACKKVYKEKYFDKSFLSNNKYATVQRNAILQSWQDYLTQENKSYTPSQILLISDGITKNLKPNNDTIPPVLNKSVLADTITEIEHELRADRNYNFNFNKLYTNNLRIYYLGDDEAITQNGTGWVIIPSKENDPDNFEENVEKLQALSHKGWCTKSSMAEPYLSEGDFHVYLENGSAKLGVRFDSFDEIAEIQGEKNNSKIPIKYLSIFKQHLEEGDYYLSQNAQDELNDAEFVQKKIDALFNGHPEVIKNGSVQDILETLGIKTSVDEKDGKLIIEKYCQPEGFSFDDLNIDENKLFREIKEIKGDADFYNSKVTDLGALEYIRGAYDFSPLELKSIGNFKELNVEDFANLMEVSDFSKVETLKGVVSYHFLSPHKCFKDKKVSLPSLTNVVGTVYLPYSEEINLPKLETVTESFDVNHTKKLNLENLKTIMGSANFDNSGIDYLPNLQKIRSYASFCNCPIEDLSSFKEGLLGEIYLDGSNVKKIGIPGVLESDDEYYFDDAVLDDFETEDYGNYDNPWGYAYDESERLIIDYYKGRYE